jgi:hypothetical protein
MSDAAFFDALRRKGHRAAHFGGRIPIRLRFAPWWTRPDLRRDYLPAMASADGRSWWTVAYWHRLQVGPFIFLWRTRITKPVPATTKTWRSGVNRGK